MHGGLKCIATFIFLAVHRVLFYDYGIFIIAVQCRCLFCDTVARHKWTAWQEFTHIVGHDAQVSAAFVLHSFLPKKSSYSAESLYQ